MSGLVSVRSSADKGRYVKYVGYRVPQGAVVHAEGATKGILITTSGFGPSSYEFANGKPLQLYDGTRLLWLCHQQGIEARIVMPPKTRKKAK